MAYLGGKMSEATNNPELAEQVTTIVAAFVSHNAVAAADLATRSASVR